MDLDPLEVFAGTAEAAFATDEEGRIVIWNRAAEALLGYEAAQVLGRPCHTLICGKDIFGNRFCSENCCLNQMVSRHEPAHRFELDVRTASNEVRRVSIGVIVVPGPRASQFTMVHLVQPATSEAVADGTALLPMASEREPSPPASSTGLTAREVEVLSLMAEGTSTRNIADSLFISVTTVRHHIQNILKKLDAHSKLEAVSLALRHRLV